jgi:hypothetical protein
VTKPIEPWFSVGQRVVCVDDAPNPLWPIKPLARGRIYVIRAIDTTPGWKSPRWGVHVEGIYVAYPDLRAKDTAKPKQSFVEWAMKPSRFRAVVDRPTDIGIFKRMLLPTQLRLPLEEE